MIRLKVGDHIHASSVFNPRQEDEWILDKFTKLKLPIIHAGTERHPVHFLLRRVNFGRQGVWPAEYLRILSEITSGYWLLARKSTFDLLLGERTAGRPKKRWIEEVERKLKGMGVKDWKRLALERDKWEKIVEKAKA
jgi:hypothetical protein